MWHLSEKTSVGNPQGPPVTRTPVAGCVQKSVCHSLPPPLLCTAGSNGLSTWPCSGGTCRNLPPHAHTSSVPWASCISCQGIPSLQGVGQEGLGRQQAGSGWPPTAVPGLTHSKLGASLSLSNSRHHLQKRLERTRLMVPWRVHQEGHASWRRGSLRILFPFFSMTNPCWLKKPR